MEVQAPSLVLTLYNIRPFFHSHRPLPLHHSTMLSSLNLLLAIAAVHGASAAIIPRAPIKIVQSNDDGWGVANIRRLFDVLNASGFSVRPPSFLYAAYFSFLIGRCVLL